MRNRTDVALPAFKPYTFGAMWLGAEETRRREDIRIARAAMDAGVWFHASSTYNRGLSYAILRMAFNEAPNQRPPLIIKIRDFDAAWLRFEVEDTLRRLGVDHIDIAQLRCDGRGPGGMLADTVSQGPLWTCCRELEAEGKVTVFYVNCFRAFDDEVGRAVDAHAVQGVILYWSPLEREASDALFARIQQENLPLISLRTLAQGIMFPGPQSSLLARNPSDPRMRRLAALRPVYGLSGCRTWGEFSIRYLVAQAGFCTTVGGTGSLVHLREFLDAPTEPLPIDLVRSVDSILSDAFDGPVQPA
jgi:aryl-alcohol dehydrogenase-like predicted oxidoreductase